MSTNRPAQNIHSIKGRFLLFLLFLAASVVIPVLSVSAAPYPKLPNRSLRIDDATPGATTTYTISWSYPAATTIGSIRLLMCDNSVIDEPCVNPNGDLSTAVLFSQTGVTGFTINSQSANEILLTRAPAAASTVQSTYVFNNAINPTGLQRKFFIRILTYDTGDGSGAINHASSVVSATTEPIVITSEVPPILYFCAALTIDLYCQNTGGNQINYGNLSAVTGNYATSQFGVATNAQGGYIVTINGDTMASGTRTIPETSIPSAFTTGVAQFGLNLRANTSPPIGADPVGLGIGTADVDYSVPDSFKYIDGDIVASSVTGTLFDIFTVTYIVNIPPDQAAGVYSTTIAYICTAAF